MEKEEKKHIRGDKMSKALPRLEVDDLHRRDLDIEECPGQTRTVVCQLDALFVLAKEPGLEISLI